MGQQPFKSAPARKLVGFRRVEAKHPEVKELQDAFVAFAAEVNARLLDSYFHGIPIGVPFPFLSSLFPAGFSLGEKFVECYGQTVAGVGESSPMLGMTIPAITDQLGASGIKWFVRVKD